MGTREPPFRRWAPRCHVISHKSRHAMCLYVASLPPHKCKSGLITLQIVWFSYSVVQVCVYCFSCCIETHVSHVCVRKIMLILI